MLRRPGIPDSVDYRGEYTFGHNLLTAENIEKLADQADHWAVILRFDNSNEDEREKAPQHALFPRAGLINLFDQGKLSRITLLTGFRTGRSPPRPVPACFFRTLDFLLQYVDAGNTYRAINDKEYAKGFPPAAWCRPPVVAAREEAEAMTAAALAGTPPGALARAPATDPIRLFYAARSWCLVYQFHRAAAAGRPTVGVPSAEVYRLYCEGQLSPYVPLVGLVEEDPPPNTWVPPCVMLPLGAVLYMHQHGRPYLPLTLNELRDVRNMGIMSVTNRPDARPMQLPLGVWPAVDPVAAAALPPGMGPAGAGSGGSGGATATGGRAPGVAAAAVGGGSRQTNRAESSAAVTVIPGRDLGPAAGSSRQGGGGGSGGGAAAGATTPRSIGRGRNGVAAESIASAAAPPPPPEPDPILNSSNWIMPQPFDTPLPPPLPEPLPAADAATAATDAAHGGSAHGAAAAAAAVAAAAAAGAAAAGAAAALNPSPFLQLNLGVQPHFETPLLRLFLGERGQVGLSANWWYVDSESKIQGPYSPEAMLLSVITPCRELHDDTLVCGTDADVRPPMLPPLAAFLPLNQLLEGVIDGTYALVSRGEIVSPLTRSFLGNRIRQPKPEPLLAPSTAVTPVMIAVQQPQQQAAAVAQPPVAVQAVSAASQQRQQQQMQARPPPPQQPQQRQQQQQAPPVFAVAPGAGALQGAMHGGLSLPHLMGARPRPAFTLPGSVPYMLQYGQAVPYGDPHAVMAQPVLGPRAHAQVGAMQVAGMQQSYVMAMQQQQHMM